MRKREILIDDGGERRVLNLFYKGNKNVINFTSVRRARGQHLAMFWQAAGFSIFCHPAESGEIRTFAMCERLVSL